MPHDSDDRSHSITNVLDRVCEGATGETTTVGDVLSTVGRQGFGPLIMLIGLLSLMPLLGGIPGASIIFATLILLLVGQLLVGRSHPWMPRRILNLGVRSSRVKGALRRIAPYARKLEVVVRPRLTRLSGPAGQKTADIACMVNALLMYPLAIVPYGVTLPSAALFALGLGMTARDGVLIVAGLVFTAASLWMPFYLL